MRIDMLSRRELSVEDELVRTNISRIYGDIRRVRNLNPGHHDRQEVLSSSYCTLDFLKNHGPIIKGCNYNTKRAVERALKNVSDLADESRKQYHPMHQGIKEAVA